LNRFDLICLSNPAVATNTSYFPGDLPKLEWTTNRAFLEDFGLKRLPCWPCSHKAKPGSGARFDFESLSRNLDLLLAKHDSHRVVSIPLGAEAEESEQTPTSDVPRGSTSVYQDVRYARKNSKQKHGWNQEKRPRFVPA
jgi:hypothetical protein